MQRLKGRSGLRGGERATSLVLAPALVFVLLVLGAVAVDLSLAHTARRSAYRSLTAAADDAAAMVDAREFQRSGEVRLDADGARRVARAHLGLLGGAGPEEFEAPAFEITEAEVTTDPNRGVVRIEATVVVERVFGSAVPGIHDSFSFPVVATGRML